MKKKAQRKAKKTSKKSSKRRPKAAKKKKAKKKPSFGSLKKKGSTIGSLVIDVAATMNSGSCVCTITADCYTPF